MMRRGLAAVTAAATVLAIGGVAAGTRQAIVLDRDMAARSIAAIAPLRAIALSSGLAKGKELAEADNPLAQLLAVISDTSVRGAADAAVRGHGFADLPAWAAVSREVAGAYAHLRLKAPEKKLAKAIAKIEKNDFLPEKQKKQLIAALQEAAGEIKAPPEANLRIVKDLSADLEKALSF